MLLVWLLIRWQRVRDDRLLLVLDLVIGIAGMTKFQVMLLCLVLLVTTAVCGPRGLLRARCSGLRAYRYLGGTFVALYVVFVATAGRPYYLVSITRSDVGENIARRTAAVSPTSAMTCTPSSAPANWCSGPCCGPTCGR
jgi:hypothetical protein